MPILSYISSALTVVASFVCLPGTTSTNGKIYTGWNGCATTKRSGCFKFCCNSEGIIPEVLDPIIASRSEEHTSELQSRFDLVCRLLLEKKKKKKHIILSDRPQQ